MLDVPKPGSHFYSAYQAALDWCDDVPGGAMHDDCVAGSIASLSLREQVAADRTTLLEGAVLLVLVTAALMVTRRQIRRQ
jgi:hypothetical protein